MHDHALGDKALEELPVIACPEVFREMHVPRPWCLDTGFIHDAAFAVVNADDKCDTRVAFGPLHLAAILLPLTAFTFNRPDMACPPTRALLVNVGRKVTAGVDEGREDLHLHPVLQLPLTIQKGVDFLPDARCIGASGNDTPVDSPALPVSVPSDYLVLKTIVLCINTHGEHQNAPRNFRVIMLAACVEFSVEAIADLHFPRLTEHRVCEDLQLLRILFGLEEVPDDFLPVGPRRHKSIEPEGTDAILDGLRILADPLCRLPLRLMFRDDPLADRTLPADGRHLVIRVSVLILKLLFFKLDIVKADIAERVAVRTFCMPLFLRTVHIVRLNLALSFDGRRRGLYDLAVPLVGFSSTFGQLDRITFGSGGCRKAVCLVHEDIADRF